jgi:hypothetical protein
VVASCGAAQVELVRRLAEQHGVALEVLGAVGSDRLVIEGVLDVTVGELSARHAGALRDIVGD